MKKMTAVLTGAVVLALALPVLAVAQTSEITPETATTAAQEAAEETEQPEEPPVPTASATSDAPAVTPEITPDVQKQKGPAEQGAFALYVDGKEAAGSAAVLNWPDPSMTAPTALIKAMGPDGLTLSPVFESSDQSVVAVDASGLVTAVGYGVATITATLDAQKVFLQISVGQEIQRVVIIGEDSVSPGRSIKLRAFDQDGNRISAVWRTSSDRIASISPDGVLTASRAAEGQTVDITALAGEGAKVYAVKTIQIG